MAAIAGQPGTKPSQLPESPTKEQQKLLDEFFADYSAPEVDQSGDTGFTGQVAAGREPTPVEGSAPSPAEQPAGEQPGMFRQGLDYAGRALDYVGGLSRTGLAEVAGIGQQIAQGKNPLSEPQIVTEEDVNKALRGQAPNSAEYLRRLGVPEAGSVEIAGTKFTTRGAVGLATDIATDPLTAITKLIKKAPYLGKLINSSAKTGIANKATEALGETVYKSALPKGAEAAGEVLLEKGAPVGGSAALVQRVNDLSDALGKTRQGLYDKATELGVTIDTGYPLKRAEAMLSNMRKDPGLAPVVTELESLLSRYKSAGKVPLDILSEWKTNLYDALPASAWTGNKLKGKAKAFKHALAADFRQLIIDAGNTAEKGLGDAINVVNEQWGALLSATRPLEKATQATGGKLGLMIDGAIAAGAGPQGYIAKKGFDIATSPGAKTLVGRALIEAGKRDLASRIARQASVGVLRETRPASESTQPDIMKQFFGDEGQ